MLFSKFAVYDSKISKLVKQQVAKGLLSKIPLSKIPLVGPLFSRGLNKLIQDIK